jgi:site-specific DNA-methyltransferase (adenine-specific)
MIELINGDCWIELPKIYSRYQDRNIILVSDPPFNIGYHYDFYQDNMDEFQYYSYMGKIFREHPCVIIHYPENMYKLADAMGTFPLKLITWVYNSNTAKQHRDIAFFKIKPDMNKVRQPYKNPNDKRIIKYINEGQTGAKLYDWWEINQVKNVSKEKTSHPCQTPLEVMKRIIGVLPENSLIIDPFMGSGTTGVACMELQRDFIGIDIDKKYVNIAIERLKNHSVSTAN